MKHLKDVKNLKGKRVVVRVDYNVPIKKNAILDPRRIEASYATIDFILKQGGTPILIAHRGEAKDSLLPVARYLQDRYQLLFLSTDPAAPLALATIERAKQGSVVLLENIRRHAGEEQNRAAFAKALARLGHLYVNDAFSASHRAHASIVGVPRYLPSCAGFQLAAEIKALSAALTAAPHPFLFILGGAKFSTKIPLIERFAKSADHLVITGAILNTFYQAAGFSVGKSVAEKGYSQKIKKLLKNPKLLLPGDIIVRRGRKDLVLSPDDVQAGDVIVDIGPESVRLIAGKIRKAKLTVWNGPAGWYEKGYDAGTVGIAKACADAKGRVIVGGGDTAAVIEKVLGNKKNIFLSTGGGAALEYLSRGTLPGIEAIV